MKRGQERERSCLGRPGESGLVSRGSQGLRSPLESRRASVAGWLREPGPLALVCALAVGGGSGAEGLVSKLALPGLAAYFSRIWSKMLLMSGPTWAGAEPSRNIYRATRRTRSNRMGSHGGAGRAL